VQEEQTSKPNLASGELFQVTPSKKKGDTQGPKEGDLAWFNSSEGPWVWGITCPSLRWYLVVPIASTRCLPPQGSWRKVADRAKWNRHDSGIQQQSPQPWVNCAFLSAF